MKTKVSVIVALLLSVVIANAFIGCWGFTYRQYVGTFMSTGVSVRAESDAGNSATVQNFNYPVGSDTTKYEIVSGQMVLGRYYSCIHAWKSDEYEGHNYNGFTWGGGEIQRNVVLQVMP